MDKLAMSKLTELLDTKYDVPHYAIKRIQGLFEQFEQVVEGQNFNMQYHRVFAPTDCQNLGSCYYDHKYDHSHWDITDIQYAEFKSSGLFDLVMSLLNDLMDLCESAIDEEGEKDNVKEVGFYVKVTDKRSSFDLSLESLYEQSLNH